MQSQTQQNEDLLKKKLRKVQKRLHSIIIKKRFEDVRIVIDTIDEIINILKDINSELFIKCSNCKVIDDVSCCFRSPLFNNEQFTMPVTEVNSSNFSELKFLIETSGVNPILKYNYEETNYFLYFTNNCGLLKLLTLLKDNLSVANSEEISDDLKMDLHVWSVILPSSILFTPDINDFLKTQRKYFNNNLD
ncbi:hypothetical protein ABK040_013788 [Willaertia magna]